MKETALDYLVCPHSQQPLRLEAFTSERGEIIDGLLHSPAGMTYPVIEGVPRMLPERLRNHLRSDYPAFFAKHGNRVGLADGDTGAQVQRLTQEAFGYEWTWAADYDANNFSDWLPEGFVAETLFAGKVGLEVGCGAGRHAYRNSQFAQMHFAVDLSRAVDSAFVRNRYSRNCHIVQADAFSLPFRPSTFDYVYCLGVLQHMHDPPVGFRELSKQPKQGGILLVNVYQASRPWTEGALECVRAVSTRLSNENLKRISVVAGYLEYGLLTAPWKLLRQTQFGRMIRPLVPMRVDEYAKHDLRTAIVDWFDRLSCPVKLHFRREDLMRWYAECGYEDIVVTPYWKAFWNGYGRRRNDAIPG